MNFLDWPEQPKKRFRKMKYGAGEAASAAAIVSYIGIAVSATSTAYAVAASRAQGRYQAQVEEENRKQGLIAAADAIQRGDVEETAQRTRTRLLISEQRAKFAASGIDVSQGTPIDVTSDTAAFGEMDALTIRSNAQREAWGYVAEAEGFKRKANLTRLATRNSTGSTLITGGADQLNAYRAGL
jgi:hypothetical protein